VEAQDLVDPALPAAAVGAHQQLRASAIPARILLDWAPAAAAAEEEVEVAYGAAIKLYYLFFQEGEEGLAAWPEPPHEDIPLS
jgi:hypothetical protein